MKTLVEIELKGKCQFFSTSNYFQGLDFLFPFARSFITLFSAGNTTISAKLYAESALWGHGCLVDLAFCAMMMPQR